MQAETLAETTGWWAKRMLDAQVIVIYYALQHWEGGDPKIMSSNHSEVAES